MIYADMASMRPYLKTFRLVRGALIENVELSKVGGFKKKTIDEILDLC